MIYIHREEKGWRGEEGGGVEGGRVEGEGSEGRERADIITSATSRKPGIHSLSGFLGIDFSRLKEK